MRARWLLLMVLGCGEVGRMPADAGFFTPGGRDAAPAAATDAGPNVAVQVGWVVDGDTVRLNAGSGAMAPDGKPLNQETVRLLGVDAPEIAHPNDPTNPTTMPECWGDEAHAAARNLMLGLQVRLEYGSSTLRDDFGRLLAYLVLPDQRVANELLISAGDAKSFRRYAHRDRDRYNQLEAEARTRGGKVWGCP